MIPLERQPVINKIDAEEKRSLSFKRSISDKNRESFYRELNILLTAGVDFKKALEILSNQTKNRLVKEIIDRLKTDIVFGKSIAEAMQNSKQFSNYEFYSVRIGEETRKLNEVLLQLQRYFQSKIDMKRQIISVITYPLIVLLVTFGVLYFMLNKVVPMFGSVFRQFGSELPSSTRFIIKLSNHSSTIFTVALLVLAGLYLANKLLSAKNWYREASSSTVLKIPFFGGLIKKIYLARFCQSMSLLTSSKTSLITSLELTSKMINFYPIETSLKATVTNIKKGASLYESLKKHSIYESRLLSMIDVAEQVNQLDSMFEKLSEQYSAEIKHESKMIGVIMEPIIIIFIGLIVGVIMIAMYAPMFDLSKIIKV